MNQKFGSGSIWRPRLGAAGVSSETVGAGTCARPAARDSRRRTTVFPRVAFRLAEGDCLRREALEDPFTGLGFRLGQAFYAWFNPHHLQSGRFQRPYLCRLQPFSIAEPHLHDGEILELTHHQKFFKTLPNLAKRRARPQHLSPSTEAARTAPWRKLSACRVETLLDSGPRTPAASPRGNRSGLNTQASGRRLKAQTQAARQTRSRTSDLPSTAWRPIRYRFHSLRQTHREKNKASPISRKLLEINRLAIIPQARDTQRLLSMISLKAKTSYKLWAS